MKNKIIIDANIILKLFSAANETQAELTRQLMKFSASGVIQVIAPIFLLIETINILSRKKKAGKKDIRIFIQNLPALGIFFVELKEEDAIKIADLCVDYQISAYDAQYLFLALKENCRLLTVDKELLKIKDVSIGLEDFFSGNGSP